MKQRIIIVGAGSHAKVVLDLIETMGSFEIVGLTDPDENKWGELVLSHPVLGGDDLLPEFLAQGISNICLGVGSVNAADNRHRAQLYRTLTELSFEAPNLHHPSSIISNTAVWTSGAIVMAGSIINASSTIGNNVLINTGAIIEHDCNLENHAHIGPGAKISGGVQIKEGVFVGLGACIKQNLVIGEWAPIGAGAVVLEDVPANATVVGNPAKPIRDK